MIKSKTKIRGPRLSFIFYFIDGYGTHVKDIMIYPRGQKIVFQVAAAASYTSNQASSFDQITRRGMRITLVDFFQYVNIIGSINVYRRFRSHRVHNNGLCVHLGKWNDNVINIHPNIKSSRCSHVSRDMAKWNYEELNSFEEREVSMRKLAL